MKNKKRMLIIAAVLIVVGAVVAFAAIAKLGFNFETLNLDFFNQL